MVAIRPLLRLQSDHTKAKADGESKRSNHQMPSSSPPPPPPPKWSVTLCLRHRSGLEVQAAAENVLPGWGHGGERLSFLLRLRRRLRLAATAQCGRAPASTEPEKPRACRILRFLRGRARVPRVPSIWRRKKPPNRALMRPPHRERVWTAKTTTVLCFVAVLAAAASIAVFRLTTGYHCTSWRCFLAKRFAEFLEPPLLYEWLPKLTLKWLLNK